MTHRFAQLMFTPAVRAQQARLGSRGSYERLDEAGAPANDRLGEEEAAFLAARDSFYMATVSETGWPYVQHRGGPPGFLKVLDERTIGFADYKGNRQYVSVGNLSGDDRVSIILVDYPNRRRLKVVGRVRLVNPRTEPDLLGQLRDDEYGARIERAMVIAVEGFDWNCPQHITPRFTKGEVHELVAPLIERLRAAEASRGAARPGPVLGRGPIEVEVVAVEQLATGVRGYKLRATPGHVLPPWEAGAHVALPVTLEDGRPATRTYSLAGDPATPGLYEVAVLDAPDGRGGSRAVHRDYRLGQRLRIAPPANGFRLDDRHREVTLVAGGIGVTAIRSMALTARRAGLRATLHYVGRSPEVMAYLDELTALDGVDVRVHLTGIQGRPDPTSLLRALERGRGVYVCGPQGLIDAVRDAAARSGWPEGDVRAEAFSVMARPEDRPFGIVLARSGRRIAVAANQTALDALEEAGLPVASSCRTGTCRTCVLPCLGGEPDHRDAALTVDEHASGLFTPCVSRARTTELILDA